jgi:putative oxidoreductase
MNSLYANLARLSPHVLSVLRVVTALLFLEFALWKLIDFPTAPDFEVTPLYYVAGLLELVGGSLLLLGLFTRPVAFVLSGESAAAYFYEHAPQSFFPIVNEGIPAIMFCFVCFYIAFAGGGAFSLDWALHWRTNRPASGLSE